MGPINHRVRGTGTRGEEVTAMEIKPRLWTVQDVADYLGIPVGTLYDWRCKGYGPRAKKVGRYLRYEADVVRQWFDNLDEDGAA